MYRILLFLCLTIIVSCNSNAPDSQKTVHNYHFTKYYEEYDVCHDREESEFKFIEATINYSGFKSSPKVFINGIKVYVDGPGRYNLPMFADQLCYYVEGKTNKDKDLAMISFSNDSWKSSVRDSLEIHNSNQILITGSQEFHSIEKSGPTFLANSIL